MARHTNALNLLLPADAAGERPDHRQIHAHRRRRRRATAATTGRFQVPAIGGNDVGVEIANRGRAAQLAGQPVPKGAEDRPVLPPRTHRRRPGRDPLSLAEQVALLEPGNRGRRGGGGADVRRCSHRARHQLAVDELELSISDLRRYQL
jgi:hypothetical protein